MNTIKCLVFSAVAAILAASSGFASTVYLDQSDFTAALTSGYYFENFDSIPEYTAQAHSYDFSGNGFDWTASTTDYYGNEPADNPAAILFITDAGSIAMTPAGGNTAGSGDVLTLTFTSGNVNAIGGNFFLTDFFGNARDGSFTLTLNDGTSQTFNNVGADNFFGYVSSSPITSLTFVPPGPYNSWAAIDNLYVGQAAAAAAPTPETASIGLLAGGLCLMGAICWRRKIASSPAR